MTRSLVVCAALVGLTHTSPDPAVRRFLVATGHDPEVVESMTIRCVEKKEKAICEADSAYYLCYQNVGCSAADWNCIDLPDNLPSPLLP